MPRDHHHHHNHNHHHNRHHHHHHHHHNHHHNQNNCFCDHDYGTQVISLNPYNNCHEASMERLQDYNRKCIELAKQQKVFQDSIQQAVARDDIGCFTVAVSQNPGYKLWDLDTTDLDKHTLFLIAQSQNPIDFLNPIKSSLSIDDINYLVGLILSRNSSDVQVNKDFEILSWLLKYKISRNYAAQLNQLAASCYDSNPVLAKKIFSHKTVGAFYSIKPADRTTILAVEAVDNLVLTAWYNDPYEFFYAQTLADDLLKTNQSAVFDAMCFAASQNWNFEPLSSNLLSCLLESNLSEKSQVILKYLVTNQPQLLVSIPVEKRPVLFERICGIYDETYVAGADQGLLLYEQSLLAQVKTAFEYALDAKAVVDFALKLESQWKADQLSYRSIEIMLKLAKTNILSRLKTGSDLPNEQLAQFLGKHRTTYHLFCLPFHLTLFSTTSTKTYQLYSNSTAFYQAVDTDMAASQREYDIFMQR